MTLTVAVVAGVLIGLSLGALGGGGSILAVPVLVHLLGQGPAEATTGSLVVVGVTSVIGAVTAHRSGHVLLGQGLLFGLVATGGAVLGALGSTRVPGEVLLAAFAALLLVVAATMLTRLVRTRRQGPGAVETTPVAEPVISFHPTFVWHWPRALKVLATATVVGALTGFLGVGGGFLVVPALVLALGLSMRHAVGTSLVVIAVTSAVALAVRAGADVRPDWGAVLALTVASALAAVAGARLAARVETAKLQAAFTGLVLVVAVLMASQAAPGLL